MTAGPWAWVGDGLVDVSRTAVHVDDRGFTNGDGCFETLKVVGGEPFALTRHLARLQRSCAALGIAPPDHLNLRSAVRAVVQANEPGVGRVRITVTAGRDGTDQPTLAVLTFGPRVLGPTAVVVLGPWLRNDRSPLTGVKPTSYAENTIAYRWAAEHGADDVLFANTRGDLCEGAGSNVFLVVDGVLRTPPLSSGCLAGVTRELVCELAAVDESPVPLSSLDEATEGFLTSSTRDVHPISSLNGRSMPGPGPVTASLQEAWRALGSRTFDP